jgi:hypothetical protein
VRLHAGLRCSCTRFLLHAWEPAFEIFMLTCPAAARRARLCRVPDGPALVSVLEAASYAGRSLARVGLDFRPHLGCAVSAAARSLLRHHLAMATAMFYSSVESHKWVAMPVAPQKAERGVEGDSGGVLTSAHSLMSHPPVAVLVNAVRGRRSHLMHTLGFPDIVW